MSNKYEVKTGQFPLFGILGLIFVTLKLTGDIDWSWWFVTGPFWMPFAVVLFVGIFFVFPFALAKAYLKRR